MYIPIDEKTFNQLKQNVIATSQIGSAIHGTKNENSDDDILYLYYDKNYNNGIVKPTNGWQFKDKTNKIDHNFQELRTFIQNVINAESHTDHEAIVFGFETSDSLLKDILNQLNIITYRTIKSYAGRAKKDLKAIENILSNHTYDKKSLYKKQYHFYYGISYLSFIVNQQPMPNSQLLSNVKNNGLDDELFDHISQLKIDLDNTIKLKFENGELKQRPSSEWFKTIDSMCTQLVNNYNSSNKFSNIQFGNLIYDVMEHTPTGFHTK